MISIKKDNIQQAEFETGHAALLAGGQHGAAYRR